MDRTIAAMMAAARAGGEVALGHYRRGVTATLKPDRSPVTVADREAEEAIVAALHAEFPGHGFLGEELGAHGSSGARFIVDPIDGTRNFIRGIPIWATLIGLEEAGRITAGVVYQPLTQEIHTARRGDGAFRNGERIRVSAVASLATAMLVHPSLTLLRGSVRSAPNGAESVSLWDGFLRLVDATSRQRGFGDFLCYTTIAEGKADLGLGANLKPWDVAPLALLVEEAGGRVTDLDGVATIGANRALASNGWLHDAALALLGSRAPRSPETSP